ncbi:hypothetical protein B0H10DRAFT_2231201 [Mycena sp. CBHHK59/15]|nr:hypothetical protein B0H10DRAFT_2231201 [Mycena sp. CBHHK59/15]
MLQRWEFTFPRDHPRPLRRPFLVTAVVDSSHIHQNHVFGYFKLQHPELSANARAAPRRPLHVVGAHVSGPYRPKTRLLSIPSPSTQDSAVRALALASQASQRRRRGHPECI